MISRRLIVGSLVGVACLAGGLNAADPSGRLVAAVQDEVRRLPEDNTALFSRLDRRVRFQLVKLTTTGNELLAGTRVKVIGPEGRQSEITSDENGIATLEEVTPGLHAAVVSGLSGHSAIPIAVRERDDMAGTEDGMGAMASPLVTMPVIDVSPQEVFRLANYYLPPTNDSGAEIDEKFVATGEVAPAFGYRVRLGDGGQLRGQVYTLLRDQLTIEGVAGTNVLLYRGNSPVARAVADDGGRFMVSGIAPGVYGLVAAGAGGYAAFGLEAYDSGVIADTAPRSTTSVDRLVSLTADPQEPVSTFVDGDTVPVVLIPPPLLEGVLDSIRAAAFGTGPDMGLAGDGFAPVPGAGQMPMGAGPGGGGFGGAGGGMGGGGIGGLAGLGVGAAIIGAVIAATDDDDNVPQFSSPSGL